MQEIDKTVLQLVKDHGKTLTKTIGTNNRVSPPSPGVPAAQVIVNPILLPLNAPPKCQWSIATAVSKAGSVVENVPQANTSRSGQNVPASLANPQAQNNPTSPGPPIPQDQNKDPGLVIIPAPIQGAAPMSIFGSSLGMQYALQVNAQAQIKRPPPGPAITQAHNNPPSPANPQVYHYPLHASPTNLQGQNNPPPP